MRSRILLIIPIVGLLSFVALAQDKKTSTKERADELLERIYEVADSYPLPTMTADERKELQTTWYETETLLLTLVNGHPNDFYLRMRLGECYRMGHNMDMKNASENATNQLLAAIRLRPDLTNGYLALGRHYTFSGKPDKGEIQLQEALKRSSKERRNRVLYALAMACFFQNKFDDAARYSGEYLTTDANEDTMKYVKDQSEKIKKGEALPQQVLKDSQGKSGAPAEKPTPPAHFPIIPPPPPQPTKAP